MSLNHYSTNKPIQVAELNEQAVDITVDSLITHTSSMPYAPIPHDFGRPPNPKFTLKWPSPNP